MVLHLLWSVNTGYGAVCVFVMMMGVVFLCCCFGSGPCLQAFAEHWCGAKSPGAKGLGGQASS